MSSPCLSPPREGGKPGLSLIRQEALEAAWEAFTAARLRAMRSARVEDGIRAGQAWGAFLKLFERA